MMCRHHNIEMVNYRICLCLDCRKYIKRRHSPNGYMVRRERNELGRFKKVTA